jgi:hypothetical protein
MPTLAYFVFNGTGYYDDKAMNRKKVYNGDYMISRKTWILLMISAF